MERLQKIIEQYGRWAELTTYTDRIEAHVSTDFSQAVENAKSLLEAIGKEICDSKGVTLGATSSTNAVVGNYSFPASEILFNVDYLAYLTESRKLSEETG